MELFSAFLAGLLLIALIAVQAMDVVMLVVDLHSMRKAALAKRERGRPDAF